MHRILLKDCTHYILMPISLNTYSLRKELGSGELSFNNNSFLGFISKLEIDGIELWANHMEAQGWDESESRFHEFQDSLQEHSIQISALCVEHGITSTPKPEYLPDPTWIDSVREVNMERYSYAELYLDIAREFNISFVRFCYGPGFFGYKIPISKSIPFNVQLATELYGALCEHINDSSVTLCVENHSAITADPMFISNLLDAVSALKVTLDLGNLPDDKTPFMKEVIKRNRIGYVHAKFHEIVQEKELCREKFVDYSNLIKKLKEAGFNGTYSIEWAGSGDAKNGITNSIKVLKQWL